MEKDTKIVIGIVIVALLAIIFIFKASITGYPLIVWGFDEVKKGESINVTYEVPGCKDSDNGNVPSKQGTCTEYAGTHSDSCMNSETLKEWYCKDKKCASVNINCRLLYKGMCMGNKCIKQGF